MTQLQVQAQPLAHLTIGQLVVQRPARARVFEKFGLDYCCGGKKPLDEACAAKGIDLQQVLVALEIVDAVAGTDIRDWSTAPLGELAQHIEVTHHAYLKRELPRLDYLTNRVAQRHGEHQPNLIQLRNVFAALKIEMDQHMAKEEDILFPLCRELDGDAPATESHCGSIRNPITVMLKEHDDAGAALEEMRRLTDNYTPPENACNTFRAMYDSLAQLERDMHQHVHKENNILFPRAIAAEAARNQL